jgi:hypothetical protein
MQFLKANTAVDVLIGPFIDEDDGKTAETGLTITQADVRLSKNGQNIAQKNDTNAAVHDELGYHNCPLDATDTNTEGMLTLAVHESGALPVRHEFMVLAEAAYDSLFTAKDTGYMDVNVKAVSEDTTAADNLESACDNYSATRGLSGTALPDAAADAAGGLPISDLGGLDLDTQIGTDIDAILEDTGTTLPATLTTIEGKIDTIDANVDLILEDTGTTLPAAITANKSGFDKNVAVTAFSWTMVDSTDYVTLEDGLQSALRTAGGAQISKDGGAFADLTNIATINFVASGVYEVDLTATEMNADSVVLKFVAAGALTRIIYIKTSS